PSVVARLVSECRRPPPGGPARRPPGRRHHDSWSAERPRDRRGAPAAGLDRGVHRRHERRDRGDLAAGAQRHEDRDPAMNAIAGTIIALAWLVFAPSFAPAELVAAAVAQTHTRVTYDGSYRRIAYPGGDVPENIGVCTDVIIRVYRKVGIDLQVKVHE